ncbi:MAG: LPS export ABC transporter periplasmic protein LptC [Bacteroidales bacterium]
MKKNLIQAFEHHFIPLKNIAILFGVAMFFSCQSTDLEVIDSLTRLDESPIESATDVQLVYSSHATIRMIMEAPQMDRYNHEESFLELPQGIEVVFYDSLGNITSTLSARYAISYDEQQIIEAENDVVVVNENNEKLNTEHLIWDRQKGIIYSENFVKITTGDEVLYGEGMEADERFSQWKIINPRGTFSVDTGRPEGSPSVGDTTRRVAPQQEVLKPEGE